MKRNKPDVCWQQSENFIFPRRGFPSNPLLETTNKVCLRYWVIANSGSLITQ